MSAPDGRPGGKGTRRPRDGAGQTTLGRSAGAGAGAGARGGTPERFLPPAQPSSRAGVLISIRQGRKQSPSRPVTPPKSQV